MAGRSPHAVSKRRAHRPATGGIELMAGRFPHAFEGIVVNAARDQFFACSALAGNQHGCAIAARGSHLFVHGLHDGALADDIFKAVLALKFRA